MAFTESSYDPKFCETAVDVLSEGKSLAAVCVAIGVARSTLYEWRDKYPDFKKAIEMGLQHAQLRFEELGLKGMSGEIKNFAGSSWIFTMKNRFRDDYAEDKKEDKSPAESVLEQILSGKIQVKNDDQKN